MIDLALALASAWMVANLPDGSVTATLRGADANIVFLCSKDETSRLLYRPNAFRGDDPRERRRPITFRFDDKEPQSARWLYQNEYAEPVRKGAAATFARWMIASSSLTIRAEKFDRHQIVDSTFDLTGAGEALNQAFEACGISG